MKNLIVRSLLVGGCLALSGSAWAFGLGDLQKKANEAGDKVGKAADKANANANRLQASKACAEIQAKAGQIKIQVADLNDKQATWEGMLARAAQLDRKTFGLDKPAATPAATPASTPAPANAADAADAASAANAAAASDDWTAKFTPPAATVALSAIKGHVTAMAKSRNDINLAFNIKPTAADPSAGAPISLKADLKSYDDNFINFIKSANPADAKRFSDALATSAESLQKHIDAL